MDKTNKNSTEITIKNGTTDERPVSGQARAIESIINETTSLYQRLRVVAEEVHGFGKLSGGRRGILKGLNRYGPQTVPQMARARPVSRQHIQTIVNPLADEGLVELIDNPAHKRSRLVRLTERGSKLIEEMNDREARLFSRVELGISEKDIRDAAAVLRSVRESFENEQKNGLFEIKKGHEVLPICKPITEKRRTK